MRLVAALILGFTAFAFAATPSVPRQSPEFGIAVSGGKQILLSQYRGKVVALEFLFTTCPHCKHEATLITKLNNDLGSKGFQAIGVAINPMAAMLVGDFVRETGANFVVGYSEKEPALDYLGISIMERWVVPQLVLIDRKGMIRYQTPALGAEEVQNEAWLRGKIEELLKEPVAHHTTSTKKTVATAARRGPS
jgi:peroxiredoxin